MKQTTVRVTGRSAPYSFTWEIIDITINEIYIQLYFENADEIGLWDVNLNF